MICAALRCGHEGIEFAPKIVGSRFRLRDNRHLEIVDAELRDVALLPMVGGIRLDLLGDPRVRHRANVGLQEIVLPLFVVWPARIPEDEISIRPYGKFPHAGLHGVPQTRVVRLPFVELD